MAIPEGLEHLSGAFIAEMDKDCRILLELKRGECGLLAEHAHAMRGKAAMFGEEILSDLLKLIEESAVAGQSVDARLLDRVVERCGQLALYGAP